jgi:type IV pilus assembly protein PilO
MGKTSGKHTNLILIVVLIIAILFASYYYLVLPKQDEVSAAEAQVASLSSQITTVQQNIAALQTTEQPKPVDYYALRKKVPQSRAVDTLLLNIEQIEYVSGTSVGSINFNNYDSLVSASAIVDPNDPTANGTVTEGQVDPNTGQPVTPEAGAVTSEASPEAGVPTTTISAAQLPPALKLLTLNIAVDAPDNSALQLFIREIEQLERVVRVDTISYTLPDELGSVNPLEATNISASIQVTTFYYEGDQ